jgi:subtilisin family serine protease
MENMFEKKFAVSTLSSAIKLAMAAAAVGVAGHATAAADTTRVIVAFKPGSAAHVKSAVSAARGAVKHEIFGMDAMAIEVPTQALKGLQNNPNVEYVEEDEKRYPFFAGTTPSTGTPYTLGQLVPYGIKQVQADQLTDINAGNRKVCIIDSGYDRSHDDLGKGTNVTGEYDAGTGWWYTDENHHGTHVAGTIAAVNNGLGVVGVNPNNKLKLHIVKVFGADGWAYSSTLATAANKCGTAGANVISMSLGGGRSNKTEEKAFTALQTKGVLSIAAAGNDGNTVVSYPAGYASVMMVAAVDEAKAWATFSQYNSKVEIAGPGVNVLSTVPMGAGSESVLTVGATTYAPGGMDGSPKTTRSGALADFGLGDVVNPTMAGKVCLISRGTIDFATKVMNCQNSGGVGAVIYNNVAGGFGGTMGTTVSTIPSVTATDVEGASMKTQLGQTANVGVAPTNYAYFDGTSMATPHVSAVAALVWSYTPTCTGAQIRASLTKSALDLGPVGRDVKFGYGLVQAKAAKDRIAALGCGN